MSKKASSRPREIVLSLKRNIEDAGLLEAVLNCIRDKLEWQLNEVVLSGFDGDSDPITEGDFFGCNGQEIKMNGHYKKTLATPSIMR